MATRKAKVPAAPVVYLLIMRDGTKRKITLPASYKLTFGPLTPGSKDHSVNSSGALSLRVYDGPNQKAVFTGVESFRDMSIPIEEEVVKTQAETFFREGENGEKQAVVIEGAIREWQNPDAPKNGGKQFELARLPQAREVADVGYGTETGRISSASALGQVTRER